MIQRIQSVLLFVVAILVLLMYFFPIWSIEVDLPGGINNKIAYFTMIFTSLSQGEKVILWQNALISTIGAGMIGFTIFSIFLYKERMKQAKMVQILMIINLLLIALTLFLPESFKGLINPIYKSVPANYGVSCILPLICLPLIFFSRKMIIKDEKLVRSADRFR